MVGKHFYMVGPWRCVAVHVLLSYKLFDECVRMVDIVILQNIAITQISIAIYLTAFISDHDHDHVFNHVHEQ